MRRNSTPTDRAANFEERLKETMNTESDPESFTPNTAGAEELPEYQDRFPLTRQFNQTNMRGSGGKTQSKSGRGKDSD